jgi:hypothetical protein
MHRIEVLELRGMCSQKLALVIDADKSGLNLNFVGVSTFMSMVQRKICVLRNFINYFCSRIYCNLSVALALKNFDRVLIILKDKGVREL